MNPEWPDPQHRLHDRPVNGSIFQDARWLEERLEIVNGIADRRRAERDALREAMLLIQGFGWCLDDSDHGREIRRRCDEALKMSAP